MGEEERKQRERDFQEELREHRVEIWVRRGGLNHVEGLRLIKTQVSAMDLPIHVYPDRATHSMVTVLKAAETAYQTGELQQILLQHATNSLKHAENL